MRLNFRLRVERRDPLLQSKDLARLCTQSDFWACHQTLQSIPWAEWKIEDLGVSRFASFSSEENVHDWTGRDREIKIAWSVPEVTCWTERYSEFRACHWVSSGEAILPWNNFQYAEIDRWERAKSADQTKTVCELLPIHCKS